MELDKPGGVEENTEVQTLDNRHLLTNKPLRGVPGLPRPPKQLDPDRSALDRLGYELRRWRLSRQLSQKELGRRIVFSRVHVSLVETAQERPSRQFVERCDAVLEAGGALLAIYEQVRAEHARARIEVPELRPAASPLLLPTEEALDVLELARQAEASSLGAGTVETIDRAVDRFCREYPGTAPHLLIPSVGRRLGYISQLLRGRLTLTQHRALLVAGGWLTGLLACLQFDVGNREAAEACRDAAFQLSKEADHQQLMAWTFELLAWFALVDGRYPDTVQLAQTGRELAPNTSAGVQLAVQEAKGWSRLGDRRGAETALRHAAGVLSRMPTPSHPEQHFIFDASKLSFYAATCYTWLGEAEQAEEHANHVISQCLEIPGSIRWPMRLAENRVDLGLIAARRGQVDEAAHLGAQALTSERKSGGTLGRVAELDAALLRDHADVSEVQELHEQYLLARRALGQVPVR
jgi:transcriptional regulator with XRE-family HTH domain